MTRETTKAFALLSIVLAACSSSGGGNTAVAGSSGASSASGTGGRVVASGGTTSTVSSGGATSSATAGATSSASGGPSTTSGGASGTASGGTTSSTSGGAPSNGGASSIGGASDAGAAGSRSGLRPYKGVANSPCAARTALKASWYYNWGQKETEPCQRGAGGEFVPMIWGHTGAEQTASSIHQAVQALATQGYGYVLGFNEPDNSSQSNIPGATAASLWPSFDVAGILVGSPATSANSNGQTWFKDFMSRAESGNLRTDLAAIHWYGWNQGSCDAKASQLESYVKWAEGVTSPRPIWITEWGCLNQSAPDTAIVVSFFRAAVAMFAKHPRIERYAWYPWATNCELNDKSGALTELGSAFAAAPSFR